MSQALDRLRRLVDRLREECPWDREQTFATLQTYLLEESHEVLEALETENAAALKAELGDLLFQIVFLSRLARERNWFDLDEVAAGIEEKMISRHPHVFGQESARDADEVKASWEKRKRQSGRSDADPLAGIPRSLPALSTALRMSERAADLGFDWEKDIDVLSKIEEEIAETRQAREGGREAEFAEEFGDLLFALANWARRSRIDPERALRAANEKFRSRFARVAGKARASGRDVSRCTAAELDTFWNAVKDEEKHAAGEVRKP